MKKQKKSLRKWVRILLLFVIICLLLSSAYIILDTANVDKSQSDKIRYAYNLKQGLDYKVYLFKNTFIPDEYLGKTEEGYISDLIKNIEARFNYRYQASDPANISYTYKIDASVEGKYKLEEGQDKSKLWNKEYKLVDEKTVNLTNTNQFNIDENVDIDFRTFDTMVAEFRQTTKLPIDANLYVTMDVKVNLSNIDGVEKVEDNFVKDEKIVMTIPLNKQAFNISEEYEPEYKDKITERVKEGTINKQNYIIGSVLGIVGLALFVGTFKKIFNIKEKSYYKTKRDKYLKEFGDVIIEVVTPVAKKDLKVVKVKGLTELVDLEEELRIPIVFYEDPDDEEGEFTIVHDDIIYEYILTNEEDD